MLSPHDAEVGRARVCGHTVDMLVQFRTRTPADVPRQNDGASKAQTASVGQHAKEIALKVSRQHIEPHTLLTTITHLDDSPTRQHCAPKGIGMLSVLSSPAYYLIAALRVLLAALCACYAGEHWP